MNAALASTSASVTVLPKQSQLFQPIGGRDDIGNTVNSLRAVVRAGGTVPGCRPLRRTARWR